jgi:glycosyltransferase involved in cell wall biosynthesis
MKRVLIIQSQMKRYRVPFFDKLNAALLQDGISLKVAYSGDGARSDQRNDRAELLEGLGLKVGVRRFLKGRLLYHPILREVAAADLVIAEQANKHLLNYLLIISSTVGLRRVAFWGLGENKEEGRSDLSEWLRRQIASRVDWWFAYTNGTEKYLTSNGVARERITIVQNATDTREFSQLLNSISADEVASVRDRFAIEQGSPVGLFVGALVRDKGLDLLLESAERVKEELPAFHLFIVGGGPERESVETASQTFPWIHCVGPRFGREKALFFKVSDLFLLPGRVGLAILEAFAAGLPLLTTNVPYHGPEVEYLENGRSGLITLNDPVEYASGVVRVCSDPALLQHMKGCALESSKQYSIEAMVQNFRLGIHQALGPAGTLPMNQDQPGKSLDV